MPSLRAEDRRRALARHGAGSSGVGSSGAGSSGAGPSRRDPAPSRFAYRIERLWLTPSFRRLVRVGLPLVLILGGLGFYVADPGRRAAMTTGAEGARAWAENRPEFMVQLMAIDGASEPVATAIRSLLPVTLPVSSFKIDLEAYRATIEKIDAVAAAELHVRKGGVLQVAVTERQPAVLWRTGTSTLEMLDATGHRVATLLDRAARPDLPVIAGVGANETVAEALSIFRAAAPIDARVRGLIRMGERRWDVVLDRDQRIMLPEANPVAAIQRVIALDQAEDLLGRALVAIDLRNEERPTLRLAAAPAGETEDSETKVNGQ